MTTNYPNDWRPLPYGLYLNLPYLSNVHHLTPGCLARTSPFEGHQERICMVEKVEYLAEDVALIDFYLVRNEDGVQTYHLTAISRRRLVEKGLPFWSLENGSVRNARNNKGVAI